MILLRTSTLLIVLLLLCTSQATTQSEQDLLQFCNTTLTSSLQDQRYIDLSTNSCRTCTNCSRIGLETLSGCCTYNDSICACPAGHFFNRTGNSCSKCSECETGFVVHSQCANSTDTVCKCPPYYYLSTHSGTCTLDCSSCPNGGKCSTVNQCECPTCYRGPRCEERETSPQCSDSSTPPPSTVPRTPATGDTNSFSPVGSALIAVGAVFGIIVFSACFVLLGVATSCQRSHSTHSSYDSSSTNDEANINNNNNKNHIMFNGQSSSISLASLYINGHSPSPTQEYRTSLDLLRYSSNSLYSWNTLRNSPKTSRSNSVPLYLRQECTLTPV